MPGNDAPPLYSKEMVIKGRLTLILPYQTYVRLKASKRLFFDLLHVMWELDKMGQKEGDLQLLAPLKATLGPQQGLSIAYTTCIHVNVLQLFCVGKTYRKHLVQKRSNNAKQTDGLARPACQSAKLQTCLPPSHVDRRGSHVQWENPPRSVSYASVQVVEQVSLPSASISLWSGPSKQSEIMQCGQRSSGGGKFTSI